MSEASAAAETIPSAEPVDESYSIGRGRMVNLRIEDFLDSAEAKKIVGKVDLLITSPPFPLVRKKAYGNETGDAYLTWLSSLAPRLAALLKPKGSIVLEIGNAWEQGSPSMSTLPLESLLAFKRAAKLNLCQHVICHNPARLPSPAVWVNVERIRLKDSFTHVWWMSKDEFTTANNTRVLTPYSAEMKRLLKRKSYNAGRRPSGHKISKTGFLTDHGGAISANVLDFDHEASTPASLLKFAGTAWDADYRAYCSDHDLPAHPARMQAGLVSFFINFLTTEGDLIFDPFGGSNTTGAVADQLERRWITVEAEAKYVAGSRGRFEEFRRINIDSSEEGASRGE